MRKQYHCACGKKIAYTTFKYGKNQCKSCANKGKNNPMSKRIPWNYKGGKDRFPDCFLCGKRLSKIDAYLCQECYRSNGSIYIQKGKSHPNFKHGKPICKCGKQIKNYKAKLCHSCVTKKRWELGTLILTTQTICKHHLDLNPKNKGDENIVYLTHGNHQLFHRLAYHYLLEKFGLKEILKYKKWFGEKYLNEDSK
jgi:hypothetical protein